MCPAVALPMFGSLTNNALGIPPLPTLRCRFQGTVAVPIEAYASELRLDRSRMECFAA
jgi:hypothetical protein